MTKAELDELKNIWRGMHDRCYNPRNPAFQHYGGRGITVCDDWHDFELFVNDMYPRPSLQHSIDRINPDKGYSPENCRWATSAEQANTRRRPNHNSSSRREPTADEAYADLLRRAAERDARAAR